jgi:hypothetical protein
MSLVDHIIYDTRYCDRCGLPATFIVGVGSTQSKYCDRHRPVCVGTGKPRKRKWAKPLRKKVPKVV